jgi:hypothetical protein
MWLFPDPPRDFRLRRELKILCRAVHVLCVALLLGAVVYDEPAGEQQRALWLVVGSGLSILVLDLYETAAFLLQVRGLVLLVKLIGVAALPWLEGGRALLLAALILVSVVSSHAPAKLRYFVLIGRGRIRGSETPG